MFAWKRWRCLLHHQAMVVVLLWCAGVVDCRNVDAHHHHHLVKRTPADPTCDNVAEFFHARNIPMRHADNPKGGVCGGQCCGDDAEAALRQQGQEVFANMLRHNARTWQGLLNSTATSLQDHILTMASRSENKTSELFLKLFQGHAMHTTTATIATLYADIRAHVQITSPTSTLVLDDADTRLADSVRRFFGDIFPPMYQRMLRLDAGVRLQPAYARCVRDSGVQPFGLIPQQVGESIGKAFDAARLLLQALAVGVEVLDATETLVVVDGSTCHTALLRMTHCPQCVGLRREAVKPCAGYCMNVMRGCLSAYAAELDAPWNGYVEGIERLVAAMKQHNNEAGVNVDAVVRELDTRISEAIIFAMEKEKDIDTKVKRACGVPKLEDATTTITITTTTTLGKSSLPLASSKQLPSADGLLLQFLASIAKSRGFYGTLADSLCADDSFAEPTDERCWNGERVGGYAKPVVDASVDTQRYNPEVVHTVATGADPRVVNLADKLRHVYKMVMSSLGSVSMPESDSYMQGMQGDATDGSGSGGGPPTSDDEENEHGEEMGSGVGSGSEPPPIITENLPDGKTAGAATITTTFFTTFAVSCVALVLL